MTLSIDSIVKVVPGVITPAGTVNVLTGMVFSTNTALDAGVSVFTTAADVATKCGADSIEAQIAAIYFASYVNTLDTPSKLYFYQIPATPVAADYGTYLSAAADTKADWAPYMFAQEPEAAAKTAIATWMAANPKRYWGVIQDKDETILTPNATTSFGATVKANKTEGLTAINNVDGSGTLLCAGALSWAASINPNRVNGRATLMFREFAGLTPGSLTNSQAQNLLDNGYNYYGNYKPVNTDFNWFVNGQVSGTYLWADAYLNQIWMNANFQNALAQMFSVNKRIPYDAVGDTIISASVQPDIQLALTFGAIDPNVSLSSDEALQVNAAAGVDIASTLQTQGWYLIPGASRATPDMRANRKQINGMFFYMDGSSVQAISLNSIEVQ